MQFNKCPLNTTLDYSSFDLSSSAAPSLATPFHSFVNSSIPPVDFREWTRVGPSREPTLNDVFVPLAQAAITGGVICLCGLSGVVAFAWPAWTPGALCAAGFAFSWVLLVIDQRALMRTIESMSRAADNDIHQPAPSEQKTLRIEVTEQRRNSSSIRFLDLPCNDDAFMEIARGVLSGRPFSEREWAHVISSQKFRLLRDKLLDAGYMRWVSASDRRQGVALTRKGSELFEKVSKNGNADLSS